MAWTDPHASERWHSLDEDPKYAGADSPGTHELTSYSPAGNGPKDEVYRVTGNLSFISRVLFIIAEDKHFEDLTGEDALTIGVGDFAAGSDVALLKSFDDAYPALTKEAFGDKYDQVFGKSMAWLKQQQKSAMRKNGSYKNDHGAIVNGWFRKGVGQLLADRRLYGVQLRTWRKDKVESSVGTFKSNGFKLQFSLAAMCGMANSMGPGGMAGLVKKSAAKVSGKSGLEKEIAIMKLAVAGYASSGASFNDDNGDAKVKAAKANADAAVAAIFDGGKRPGDPEHRSLRMLLTGDWFPVKEEETFDGDLGDFELEDGEKPPSKDGATPPAPVADRPLGDKNNKKWKRHKPEERKTEEKKKDDPPQKKDDPPAKNDPPPEPEKKAGDAQPKQDAGAGAQDAGAGVGAKDAGAGAGGQDAGAGAGGQDAGAGAGAQDAAAAPAGDPKPAPQDPNAAPPPADGAAPPATVVEGGFDKIKVQLAPGGSDDKPQRPTRSTQMVWGGSDPSTPWGILAALVEQSGGSVQYTYLHSADLIRKRDEAFQPKDGGGGDKGGGAAGNGNGGAEGGGANGGAAPGGQQQDAKGEQPDAKGDGEKDQQQAQEPQDAKADAAKPDEAKPEDPKPEDPKPDHERTVEWGPGIPDELIAGYRKALTMEYAVMKKCLQFACDTVAAAGSVKKTHNPAQDYAAAEDISLRGSDIADLHKAAEKGVLKPGMLIHVKKNPKKPQSGTVAESNHWFVYMGKGQAEGKEQPLFFDLEHHNLAEGKEREPLPKAKAPAHNPKYNPRWWPPTDVQIRHYLSHTSHDVGPVSAGTPLVRSVYDPFSKKLQAT